MNNKELGKHIREEVVGPHARDRTIEEEWEAMGARARALLSGATARPPNNDREQSAMQMAYTINPYFNWRSMTHDSKAAAYRCADLALSWHAPEPMEQDVERLAIWLGFVFNENSGNEGTGWDSEYEDDRNGHRAQARALIARYGTPRETLKPIHQEELHDWLNVLPNAVTERADTRQLARLIAERYGTPPEAPADSTLTAENARLRAALERANDLLIERVHGNCARSPAHNARLLIEAALAPSLAKVAEGGAQWEVATFIAADIEPGWEPFATSDFGHVICKRRRAGGGL